MLRALLALMSLFGGPDLGSEAETDAGNKWDPDG